MALRGSRIENFDNRCTKGLDYNGSLVSLLYYSRVHISSDEVFSKILKKLSIVQK